MVGMRVSCVSCVAQESLSREGGRGAGPHRAREGSNVLVCTVPGGWVFGGVCVGVWGGGRGKEGGRGNSIHLCTTNVYVNHVLLMLAQIYQIPKFKLVFSVRNFSSAPKTLMDSGPVPLPR